MRNKERDEEERVPLTQMSEKELLATRKQIDALLSIKKSSKENTDMNKKGNASLTIFYATLEVFFQDKLGLKISPIANLTTKTVQSIRSLQEEIDKWIVSNIKRTVTRRERMKLYLIIFELVAHNISDRDIPITVTTLVRFGGSFSGVLEKAFPGYIRSGYLEMILNAGSQKELDDEDYL